jgi:two-component system sensor histidine kinase KdpD
VYLGVAPGVGKTYRMLEEGHRRAARGADVVIGYVECHGRGHTEALLDGLAAVPHRTVGAGVTDLDLDALLARRPQVALVDDLAHPSASGGRYTKRWQDVQALLDAGITVVTTVGIQQLESVTDVAARITGVPPSETVPDEVVRAADQVELVDMDPEALRRRMAHGNVYPPERIDAALGAYFRVGALTALRQLALLWLAGVLDDRLARERADRAGEATWETRERVVVALSGGAEGDALVRRAARVAARSRGADLIAVHVASADGGADRAHLARQRLLVEGLGGVYRQVLGVDIATALLDFARGVDATQLVLGASRRGRLAQLLAPGVGARTTARSGWADVHLVPHGEANRGQRGGFPLTRGLTRRRRLAGAAVAAVGLPALTAALLAGGGALGLPGAIQLYLVAVVAVAIVGGVWPAVAAAVTSVLALNWFFTPPVRRWHVSEPEDLLALVVFLLVAVAVSTVVDLAARRTSEAARARAEAQTLSTLAGSVLRGERHLPALLDQLRRTFDFDSVALLERVPDVPDGPGSHHDPAAWRLVAAVGGRPCLAPGEADADVLVDRSLSLVMRGHPLAAADRRVLEAFAAQAAAALRQERLAERAATVGPLAEADRVRTALLRAVGHDLRTPLAAAKAAVSSLRSPDVVFVADDRTELLATADESLDRLGALVDNLLDMSRLQAGALGIAAQPTGVGDILARAVDDLADGAAVAIRLPGDLPDVHADPALLERILANLLGNADRYSPPGRPPTVAASSHAGRVEIRVIDHGPGVPDADRERMFLPFQRLGDRDNTTGIGLGLALSRGLAEAMSGTLEPVTTPGGGLTMILTLPVAAAEPPGRQAPE